MTLPRIRAINHPTSAGPHFLEVALPIRHTPGPRGLVLKVLGGSVNEGYPLFRLFGTEASTHFGARIPGDVAEFDVVQRTDEECPGGFGLGRFQQPTVVGAGCVVTLANGERVLLRPQSKGTHPIVDTPIRNDMVMSFASAERGLYARIYSYCWSGTDGFQVQFDVGYVRPGEGPWTIEVESVKWFIETVPTERNLEAVGMHLAIAATTREEGESGAVQRRAFEWEWRPGALGHGQRPGFEGIVQCRTCAEPEYVMGLFANWADGFEGNELLTCVKMDGDESLCNDAGDLDHDDRFKHGDDGWEQRVLEGSEYSAAPGGGWANMGRSFYAPLIRGYHPQGFETLRSGAEGLTLLRVHNVCEEDGSPVRFADHRELRTNRQVPNVSSRDMLRAGAIPEDRGVHNRNARDLQHYEIEPALVYCALRLDHQIRASIEQMAEMDFATTYVHNNWMQSGRGVGRPMVAWLGMSMLLPRLQSSLRAICASFVRSVNEQWLGKGHLIGAMLTGGRFFAIKKHSTIEGRTMVAPYEEALCGIALAKFARHCAHLPEAGIARMIGHLLNGSVVQCFRDRGIDWHVNYLVEHRGDGLPPRVENDKVANGYTHMCIGAVREFVRSCDSGLVSFEPLDRTYADTILRWWDAGVEGRDDMRHIHWSSV